MTQALAKRKADSGEDETARLEQGIAETRASMSTTLAALEQKLSPSELHQKVGAELEHLEGRVKALVKEELEEAKALVKEELVVAQGYIRGEMNEAEIKIKRGLVEAKESVKDEIKDAYEGAKKNVRAATLGKVEDLATDVGDKMNETKDTLIETIRNNPLPAAVMGAGLVWLLMSRSRDASDRKRGTGPNGRRSEAFGQFGYEGGGGGREASAASGGNMIGEAARAASGGLDKATSAVASVAHDARDLAGRVASTTAEGASQVAHKVGEAASGIAHGASDAASTVAHGASDAASAIAHGASDAASASAHGATDAASYVSDHARQGYRGVERTYADTLRDNPLLLGGIALGAGVALGLALPSTSGENKVLGAARDRVVARVGVAAHDAAESVVHLADEAGEKAKRALGPDSSDGRKSGPQQNA